VPHAVLFGDVTQRSLESQQPVGQLVGLQVGEGASVGPPPPLPSIVDVSIDASGRTTSVVAASTLASGGFMLSRDASAVPPRPPLPALLRSSEASPARDVPAAPPAPPFDDPAAEDPPADEPPDDDPPADFPPSSGRNCPASNPSKSAHDSAARTVKRKTNGLPARASSFEG
jgi:hypothetical protein